MRRPLVAAGITLAILATVALSLWFLWLPHYRPALGPGERYGIDVSHHQGPIDWDQVAGDDISFAYIKATEGGDFTDPRFQENWEGAAAAGLPRGAYHFFTLCRSGADQARNFLRTVPDDPEALPPAVDLELSGNCSARPPTPSVYREVETFLEMVESGAGKELLLYVGGDFEERYPVKERLDRPLWQLRFLRRPATEDWVVWQVMGMAHIAGIHGDVDLDVMDGARWTMLQERRLPLRLER